MNEPGPYIILQRAYVSKLKCFGLISWVGRIEISSLCVFMTGSRYSWTLNIREFAYSKLVKKWQCSRHKLTLLSTNLAFKVQDNKEGNLIEKNYVDDLSAFT